MRKYRPELYKQCKNNQISYALKETAGLVIRFPFRIHMIPMKYYG